MHSLGLVGGTFDRFHAGHRALIEHGLSECQRLEVWLTNDQIAQAKDPRIESWSERSLKMVESLDTESNRISVDLLEDEEIFSETTKYQTPLEAIFNGHIKTVRISPDGYQIADDLISEGVFPGSFNPIHTGHKNLASIAERVLDTEICYELSLHNVDKRSLSEDELSLRLKNIGKERSVLITTAPTFVEKSNIFPGCTSVSYTHLTLPTNREV